MLLNKETKQSKAGFDNHVMFVSMTHFLWGYVILLALFAVKSARLFSVWKKHMAVHNNFLQELNQVIYTVISSFVCHLCFKVCKTAAVFKREDTVKEKASVKTKLEDQETTSISEDKAFVYVWMYD